MKTELTLHKIKSNSGKTFTALKLGGSRYKHTLSTTPTEIASMLGCSLKEFWELVKRIEVGGTMVVVLDDTPSTTEDDLPL